MNMIKLSVLKNRYPSFSVVPGILSVVGIPTVPIPIPEEIQLLMYGYVYVDMSIYTTVYFTPC